jgi:hypothetical protein
MSLKGWVVSDPLASAREKVRWAREHLKVFDKACEEFLEEKPFGFVRESGPESYEEILRFKPRQTPPVSLSLMGGTYFTTPELLSTTPFTGFPWTIGPRFQKANGGDFNSPSYGT